MAIRMDKRDFVKNICERQLVKDIITDATIWLKNV